MSDYYLTQYTGPCPFAPKIASEARPSPETRPACLKLDQNAKYLAAPKPNKCVQHFLDEIFQIFWTFDILAISALPWVCPSVEGIAPRLSPAISRTPIYITQLMIIDIKWWERREPPLPPFREKFPDVSFFQ